MFGWLKRDRGAAARMEPSVEASATWLSSDAEAWHDNLPDLFGAGGVSPHSAMRHAAVYRCVSIISFASAMLPVQVFEELGDGDRKLRVDHPTADLLRFRPNPRMSRSAFWRQNLAQMLLRGNGVNWIERKGSGDPVALWPVPFERVMISLNGDRLLYQLLLDDGRTIRVDQDDVLHFPGSAEWDGVRFKTPIQAMGSSVGIGLEADRFAHNYFRNDATPSGYIAFPAGKNVGNKDELREFWKRTFGGDNRHSGPAILDNGGEYKPIKLSAQDTQLLETRKFQIEDIARIFGVPRFLLGMDETSWGSGIEALGIGFVTYSLDPHLEAIEDEIDHKLFGRGRPRLTGPKPTKYFGEFHRDALLRGNTEVRFKAYQLALGGNNGPGWMTQNEVRSGLNLPKSKDAGADQLHQYVPRTAGEQTGKTDAQADPAPGAK